MTMALPALAHVRLYKDASQGSEQPLTSIPFRKIPMYVCLVSWQERAPSQRVQSGPHDGLSLTKHL